MTIRAYSFQSANQVKKSKSSGKGTYLKMTTLREDIGPNGIVFDRLKSTAMHLWRKL